MDQAPVRSLYAMRMDLLVRRIVAEQKAAAAIKRALVPMRMLQQRTDNPDLARMIKSRLAGIPTFYVLDAPMFEVPLLEQFAQGEIVLGILDLERG